MGLWGAPAGSDSPFRGEGCGKGGGLGARAAAPGCVSAVGTQGLGIYLTSAVLVCSGMQSWVIKKAFYFPVTTFTLSFLNRCLQRAEISSFRNDY